MWIKKYRSIFILIRIRTGRFGLTIPFPLFLVDQTLDIISDLAWLWERLNPGWLNQLESRFTRSHRFQMSIPPAASVSVIFKLCRQVINELRHYGKWRMVEVETKSNNGYEDNTRIYIDLI